MKIDKNYKPKTELRDWYFVQYYPLNFEGFSTLQLTITIENAFKNDVIAAMEKEAEIWLNLYPVPLLVSAFDNAENTYDFSEIKEQNILMGFLNAGGKICLYWRPLKKDEEGPNKDFSKDYLYNLFSDFPFTTDAEYNADKKIRRRQIERGYLLLLFVPFAAALIYESIIYFNRLFSLLAFFYIIFKIVQRALKFMGKWPKSKREKEKERVDRLKDHYYYYCDKNPEGFKKLISETLEKEAREKVKKETESLKKNNLFS